MDGLCTGVGRRDGILHLELRDGDAQQTLHELRVGDELAFEATTQRRCIGYRAPATNDLYACPDDAHDISSAQCQACFFERAALGTCLLCTGDWCRNPARRDACVQPDNHVTYLAAFAPGIVKVGVARITRRVERLAEQGARAAIIICRDDGQQVRRVETQIKRHITHRQVTRSGMQTKNVPDRLSPTDKLWAYTRKGEIAAMEDELRQMFAELRPRVVGKLFKEPETVELPPLELLATEPPLRTPKGGLRLRGTIAAIFGQLLVVDSDTGEQVALDAGSLVGYALHPLRAGEHGEGQLALALF